MRPPSAIEDKDNPASGRYTHVYYSFGYGILTEGVTNSLGNALGIMRLMGYVLIGFGVLFAIISIMRTAARKGSSLVFDR